MKSLSTLIGLMAISFFSGLFLGQPKRAEAQTPAPQSTGETKLEQQIVAKEKEGLDTLKTGNLESFGNLTADEAVFVDAQGPAGKAQVLKNVAGFTLLDYSMEGMQFLPLSARSGLIVYKINEHGNSHGHEFTAKAYVASIWAQRKGKWVCLFSQETGAK